MSRKILSVFCFALGGLFAGFGAQAQQTAHEAGDYYLRLSGSNTIGSALAPALVKAWLTQQGAENISVVQRSEPGGGLKDEYEVRARRGDTPIVIEIKFHGSKTGFEDLAAGATDVAMASRRVQPAEAEAFGGIRVLTSEASEHVIGLDGVAVIVPRANDAFFLSTKVLEDIFCGRVRNWSHLGGSNLPITLYARDDKSGTFDTFKALVLKSCPLSREARRYEDSGKLENDVSLDAGGIGFVALPYVRNTRAVPISDGDAEPLEPTRFTIKKEDYALSRRLYLYAPAMSANHHAREFINFALSDAGQEIVRMNEFVDLIISPLNRGIAGGADSKDCRLSSRWTGDPLQYCKLKKQDLLTVVYFDVGSTELDNRAKRDMRRSFAAIDAKPDGMVVFAGFADANGNYDANCALSLRRADSIAKEFRRLGINNARSVGFCPEQPVRDNGSEDGRQKNRRVEVYLAEAGFNPGTSLPPAGRKPSRPVPPAIPAAKNGGSCDYFRKFTIGCDGDGKWEALRR